jgi:hypothetical protein
VADAVELQELVNDGQVAGVVALPKLRDVALRSAS